MAIKVQFIHSETIIYLTHDVNLTFIWRASRCVGLLYCHMWLLRLFNFWCERCNLNPLFTRSFIKSIEKIRAMDSFLNYFILYLLFWETETRSRRRQFFLEKFLKKTYWGEMGFAKSLLCNFQINQGMFY